MNEKDLFDIVMKASDMEFDLIKSGFNRNYIEQLKESYFEKVMKKPNPELQELVEAYTLYFEHLKENYEILTNEEGV